MKKITSLILSLAILACVPFTFVACADHSLDGFEFIETEYAGTKLYVYNWGEYIANGDEGSLDIIAAFEKTYGIDVIYDTFDSNETMYAALKSGAANYDVIIPSDYMIERLINEGLLQKINFNNIPNYSYIDEKYKNLYFDPTNEYSIPYTVGMVGVIYNTSIVSEADAAEQSWSLLWNENYKDNILMFDNPRDAFGIAQIYLGMDVNTTSESDWQAAYELLVEQRKVGQGYTMDRIFQKMEGGNAAIGTYYAGDCLSMMDENEDLSFYYPKEGTNIFIDSMCIPASARNVGAAELFLNFLLRTDIAIENSLYLYYASPNMTVVNSQDYIDELGEDRFSILYNVPENYYDEDQNPTKAQYFHNLPSQTLSLINQLWSQLRRQ